MAMSFVDSEPLAVRMVKLGMAVDLYLGARLVGEVKQAFQSPVFNLIAKQQVCKKLRIRLLGKTRSEAAVSLLIDLLEDESYSVRLDAVNTLGQIGGKAAILGLISAFNDDNCSVRFGVIDALEQIGGESVIIDLLKTLEDKNGEIRGRLFGILLAKIDLGNEFKENLKILSYAIEHSDLDIRWGAAIALTQIDSEKSAKILLKAVRNPNFDVQFSAAFALGQMGLEIAVPILEKAIELTDSSDTCRMAIYALAKIESERSFSAIGKLFLEENSDKFKLVFTTLQSMNLEEIAPTLRRVIQDPIREFKTRIYQMLNTEDISNRLLQATQDIRPDVVKSSAFLLRTIGNPEMLSTLWQQQTRFFTEELTETIAAIQSRCGFYNYEIAQSPLPVISYRQAANFNSQTRLTIMTDKQPIFFYQPNSTIGNSYAAEGSNITIQQSVQNVTEQDRTKLQALLIQLAQTYPVTTEPQKQTFIQKFLERIESTPDLVKVLLAGGIEGLKILHPAVGIPIEMLRRLYQAVEERHNQP